MRKTPPGALLLQPVLMVKSLPGILIRPLMVYPERQISYGQPHIQKHFLVKCLYRCYFLYGERVHVSEPMASGRGRRSRRFGDMYPLSVNICTRSKYMKTIYFADCTGIFIQVAGIRLEVDYSAGAEETAVAVKEKR